VERQRLVVLALLDVCPMLLRWDGSGATRTTIWGIDIEPYLEAYEDHINLEGANNRGIWKHDWTYRHHGIGCELTNIHTEERIEWDAPDPEAYHPWWFYEHLDWRVTHEPNDPFVKAYQERLIECDVLHTLAIQNGLLQDQGHGQYYKWVEK
jgi:hypothetical protein